MMGDELDPSDFELQELLGEGAFAKVHRAIDSRSGDVFAVKLLNVSDDPDMFQKEIRMMGENTGDHIVQYFGHWITPDNEMGIVMEYCGGGALNELMKVGGVLVGLEEKIIKVICCHALRGLAWLHKHKKIHRDVKGGNVLLTEDGLAKLADFGISTTMNTLAGNQKTVIGTPFWMAPEVIGSDGPNAGSDSFGSLGITALEMAETRPPYHDKHYMKAMLLIHQNEPPKLSRPQKWSDEFNDFLATCLVKEAGERAGMECSGRHELNMLYTGADELLQHPFIISANEEDLRDFVRNERSNIMARRNQMNCAASDEGVEDDGDGTAVFHNVRPEDNSGGGVQDSGTAVFHGGVQDSGTAVFHGGVQDSGTAVFHGGVQDSGTAVFHGGVQDSGTAVFHGGVQDSGTAVFHGGVQDSGTAVFHSKKGDDDVPSDADDLDLAHKLMTEDILDNLERLDDTDPLGNGTIVFKSGASAETKKPRKSTRKSTGGRRRVSGVSSGEPGSRVKDSPEDDSKASTEGSVSADTSGSEDVAPLDNAATEKPKRKKKPKPEGAEGEETSKGKRKGRRRSLPPITELDRAKMQCMSIEQLEQECSLLEAQRDAEIARINQKYREKKEQLQAAISVRRLEEGSTK